MKRVLHVIPHLEEGGTQRQLSYVLSLSKNYEHEVASLIASAPEQRFSFFRNTSIPIRWLSETNDFYAPEIVPSLFELLRSGNYSLVHCWLFQGCVQGVLAARGSSIPCITSPRITLDVFQTRGHKRWERYLIRKALKISDLSVCPSSTVAIDFVSAGWIRPERTRIVQNGVDVDHFEQTSGGKWIVSVGRNSLEKGHEDFTRVADTLHLKFPELHCVVAGGTQKSTKDVEFLGYQEDVREVLRNAAIYVSTSSMEGMSNALLEAQAMGIPAVVRNFSSNSEIIRNGVNGFLAGSVHDYANACETLLKDESLRRRMGENARAIALAKFSIGNQIEKLESIYSELL